MFEIRSEYNLKISPQALDFLVFQNSELLDKEDCTFDTGYSVDINARCSLGDIIHIFQLTDKFEVRRYLITGQGICTGIDLYNKEFYCHASDNLVFLNGNFVPKSCYEVKDDYIRFFVEGELDTATNTVRKYVDWQTNDLVTVLSSNTTTSMKTYRFHGGQNLLPSVDLDNKTLQASRDHTVVFVNGKMLRIQDLQFGGSSLKLNVTTSTKDDIDVVVFDSNFSYFEFVAKSGQHIFDTPDSEGNSLRYSTDETSCLLEIGGQWSTFSGIRKGYYVVATCEDDGVEYLGMARIADAEFTSGYIPAEVIQDFHQTEYDSSQWFLLPPDTKDIVSYLDERTASTKLIPEVLESLQWYFFNDYADGLERIQNSRSISKMDDSFLGKTLNYLGLFLDTSAMSLTNKRRALKELTHLYSRIGTQRSTNYLGFIEDSLMTLTDALWTNDYINFYTKEELGATSYRRDLLEFTDYRFVSSEPTAFDDYGPIDVKERSKVEVGKNYLKFLKNGWVVNSETKEWEQISSETIWNLPTSLKDGEYYLLIYRVDNSFFLDVTEQIPNYSEETRDNPYYYSDNEQRIVKTGLSTKFVSLPIGKVFVTGGKVCYSQFEAFTHTDNKIFSLPGSSFSIWNKRDEIIYPERVTVSKSQTISIDIDWRGYYLVYKYTKDSDGNATNPQLMLVTDSLVHNIGVKPDPSFKTVLNVGDKIYTYNRFGKNPVELYNDDDSKKKDIFGFSDLKYDRKDLWFEVSDLGEQENFPAEAKEYDHCWVNWVEYVATGRNARPSFKYNPEIFGYERTENEGPEWVQVDRGLSANAPEIMPFLDNEYYFNLQDFKWYKFNGEDWDESLIAVVGHTTIKDSEIIELTQFTESADLVEDDYKYADYNTNTPYKRKYGFERNTVTAPTRKATTGEEVAYSWGLITDSPITGWVMYTEFDPPRGYYPTNHVLFNYTANNIEDTQDMISKAKYKFYEICPTPWVLQDIANVLLFDSATLWVGSASFGTFGIFFKEFDKYTTADFGIPDGYDLSITNNSDDYVYLYTDDGVSGTVEDCSEIISREKFGSNEYITYYTTGDKRDVKRVDPSVFKALSKNESANISQFKYIEAKVGTTLILTLSNNEFSEVYRYTVATPSSEEDQGIIDQTIHLNLIYNTYTFKVNVIAENQNKDDAITTAINGVEGTSFPFLMNDDQVFTAHVTIKQNGSIDYDKTYTLIRSDFDSNRSLTVDINTYKKPIYISFVSDLDAFDLYTRSKYIESEDSSEEDESSEELNERAYDYNKNYDYRISEKTIAVLYDTVVYYKYSKDLYTDVEDSIVAKSDTVISKSLTRNLYTVSVTVDPQDVTPVINGQVTNKLTVRTGDRVFWSAGNYMYDEKFGEFNVYGNTNISTVLELLDAYKDESPVAPAEPTKFDPITFTENGTFTIPAGNRKIDVICVGAQGGENGGLGGYVRCTLDVTPGRTYYIYVGKVPSNGYSPSYNASDVRYIQGDLNSRLIVAGGGGGSSTVVSGKTGGGAGGNLVGGTGYGFWWTPGQGGTQTSGGAAGYLTYGRKHGWAASGTSGSFGYGGAGAYVNGWHGGAGGAGWFGGGGGGVCWWRHYAGVIGSSVGGGGSSYTDSVLCSSVTHNQGVQTGNGYVTISMSK